MGPSIRTIQCNNFFPKAKVVYRIAVSDLSKSGGTDLPYRSCMSDYYSAQEKHWSAESALTQSLIPPKSSVPHPEIISRQGLHVHAYFSMLVFT
jgi:hypothetical protein